RIGEDVAGTWGDEVDRNARFPVEAVGERRASGLLGALLPPAWGGPGTTLGEIAAPLVVMHDRSLPAPAPALLVRKRI
ncbi:MAG: hypothetical protein JO368_03475, partial [Acidimicrobiales bacterium]|nr:hypothetical protein [Acidimicrobiales bacterium]